MNDMTPMLNDRGRGRRRNARPASPAGLGASPVRLGVLALLAGGLAFGVWRYQQQQHDVMAATEQRLNLVPKVRTATVKPSASTSLVTLPATTSAFATANIFARASGYIDKRNVDIGDRVKAGELLAEIAAPELDHQIAQAQATLEQTEATLQQNQANMELANVTWQRDKPLVEKGWVTLQQGDYRHQDVAGAASSGRRGAIERRCPAGANCGAAAAEGLPEGGGPLRRRGHAAQHRCR